MIIYRIVNNINNKIYIGKTIHSLNARVSTHLRSHSYIGNALRLYGLQSYTISVIDEASSKEVLNEKERYWIMVCNSKFPDGYNLTSGGDGNDGPNTEEWKRNIGIANKGKRNGKHHSAEVLKKLFIMNQGKNKGRHHTKETLEKMSNAAKAWWVRKKEAMVV